MATKKTAAEQGLQQKMKVLAKLFDVRYGAYACPV